MRSLQKYERARPFQGFYQPRGDFSSLCSRDRPNRDRSKPDRVCLSVENLRILWPEILSLGPDAKENKIFIDFF